ncbi:MAG: lysophospholipid acyltransferase family protein, partial [Armatimonadaceae bacterium]
AMANRAFVSLGRNAFDALRLSYIHKQDVLDLCTVEGEEHLRAACQSGRGVVALTGHIGCWELLAAYFGSKGYPSNVVYRKQRDARLDETIVGIRSRHSVKSIPRGASAVSAFRVLKRGEILAMLIDQDIDIDGVFVPFFGVPAHTPRGAAVFALRSGAYVVPVAIHMKPDGRHHITVRPPLEPPSEDLADEERIDAFTKQCSLAVESLIRICPEQWVWFHDRWRRRQMPDVAQVPLTRESTGESVKHDRAGDLGSGDSDPREDSGWKSAEFSRSAPARVREIVSNDV